MPLKKTKEQIEADIRHKMLKSILCILISVIIPLLAWFLYPSFENESHATWFQRSGSVSVLFALVAEYQLFGIHNYLYPRGEITDFGTGNAHKFGANYRRMTIISVTMAVTGTVIWGYGDLIFWLFD